MTVSPPLNQDQVEKKVASLQASGFDPKQLRRACLATLAASLPLRDAIVLREAERLAELETPESRQAWEQVLPAIRRSVRPSTFELWIKPLQPCGAEASTLILSAPDRIRVWTERHYSHLIREALEGTGFSAVRFVSGGER